MARLTRPIRLRALFIGGLMVVCGAALLWVFTHRSPEQLLEEAQQALQQSDFEWAESLAGRVSARSELLPEALLIASEASSRLGRTDAALDYLERLPADGSPTEIRGLKAAVTLSHLAGRLTLTEHHLRRILRSDPGNTFATVRMARLLSLEGRRWEATVWLFEWLRHEFSGPPGRDPFGLEQLLLLGGADLSVDMPAKFRSNSPQSVDDPMLRLWEATLTRLDDDKPQAEALLRKVIAGAPDRVEAHAQLGQLLLESDSEDAITRWQAQLPVAADEHPEIWFARGMWFENQREPKAAARCFAETVRRDPNHRAANYRLSRLLIGLGHDQRGAPFAERADRLQQLEELLIALDDVRSDTDRMQRAAELMESLGRLWEAWGWWRVALTGNHRLNQAQSNSDRLRRLLQQNPPLTLETANPALLTDWSSFPLPGWDESLAKHALNSSTEPVRARVVFEDFAPQAGLNFRYFNSGTADFGALKMYEFAGGGVAVLDYDGDGWQDVYLTQGCIWPAEPGQQQYRDCLYRNLGNGTFQDVTAEALLGDDRFSQGATVGDFNNDGFPDLYVANIGGNRFYLNNGDGTFSDITRQTGTEGSEWTTSCLLADLNGDTWPDLYVVNYLQGGDIFERVCHIRDKGGVPGICTPGEFEAEQDRLYLNLGDGTFDDVTRSSGIEVAGGNGLGIVAMATGSTGSTMLNLFIANDAVANFYFVNQTPSRGGSVSFAERALLSGLAFSNHGRAEACMGVAAADADGNGLQDLFVTNFHDESNTLYLQYPGGLFEDATRQAGLREASMPVLGFGTQFIDGELDGLPDLVVANGHIDNYSQTGQAYKMRPQYFRNTGGGRFEELTADPPGPWFSKPCLGRSLARLDWNRDGREDFVVSHLDVPAALLTSRTSGTGHFLTVQLRGVMSDRDAIGASIRVTTGGSTRVRQLTTGDGYQASNQRQLIVGLGGAERVDSLTVNWTSGVEQTFHDLAADQEILVIEGSPRPFRLSGVSQ